VAKTHQRRSRSFDPAGEPADPDLLAAVVLHTLVGAGDECGLGRSAPALTLAQIALACERDPAAPAELAEVGHALGVLLAADLARPEGDRYRATRAAVRAAELSF